MINVILVEDHSLIRQGLKILLRPEESIKVVGEAGNGLELLDLLKNGLSADVVLMDINMPEMGGVEATKYISKHFPELKVLALSMHDKSAFITEMLEAGASGYICKTSDSKQLASAIKMVAAGNVFISPDISINLLNHAATAKESSNNIASPEDLSPTELKVLKLIAEGLTNQEIADKLFNSRRTIETHRQNILSKTKCKNTPALVKYAVTKNIISD